MGQPGHNNDAAWTKRRECVLCHETERRSLLEKEVATYVRCARCGLVYTDPAPSAEMLADVADEWAEKHHAGAEKLKWEGNAALRQIIYGPRIWRFEQYRYTGRLLEVGCATGDFLEHMKALGWEVYGNELVSHTARMAATRVGCEVRRGPFEESGFDGGMFDVVAMWDVIEHLLDPMSAIMEAWRVLRTGGLLAMITPNYNSITRRLIGAKWEAVYPSRHVFLFDPSTMRRMIALSGGKMVSLRTIDLNPMDITSGLLRRNEYNFDTRLRGISAVKGAMVKRPWLGHARNGFNALLNLTGMGEVMEVMAERGP